MDESISHSVEGIYQGWGERKKVTQYREKKTLEASK
jgi:hypothetical protein